MTQITRDEIETTLSDIHNRLTEAKRQICESAAEKLVGRQITIRRDLKNPATGLRWTYEDEMLLEVTFVHPTTGPGALGATTEPVQRRTADGILISQRRQSWTSSSCSSPCLITPRWG
jgi:hypothetical protein